MVYCYHIIIYCAEKTKDVQMETDNQKQTLKKTIKKKMETCAFVLHTCITGRASLALSCTPQAAKPVPPWWRQQEQQQQQQLFYNWRNKCFLAALRSLITLIIIVVIIINITLR